MIGHASEEPAQLTTTRSTTRLRSWATVPSGPPLPAQRWRVVAAPAALATVATAVVTLQEVGKPSPWRDEAVTLGVSTRSFTQILHGGAHIDAVLTPYYLAMHLLLGNRPDIYLARLPSVAATALTAGLLTVLAARLGGIRSAYLAGALFTIVPMTSRYAQEARPYAFTELLAVIATLLLVRALGRGDREAFTSYLIVMVLLVYTNLLAILLLAAHGLTVCGVRGRDRVRSWLACAIVTVLASAPLVWFGSRETVALQNLRRPGLVQLASDLSGMSGSWRSFWFLLLAVALGLAVTFGRRAHDSALGLAVAWPWLLVPPLALFAVSQLRPLYADRYLALCLPAFVLVIALAVSRLPWPLPVALLVVVGCLTFRVQHNIRSEAGHTEDLRNLAGHEIRQAEPGDALLFLPARLRVIEGAYPAMTRNAADVALARSAAASGTLYGTEIAPSGIGRAVGTHQRVWLVTSLKATTTSPLDAAKLQSLTAGRHLIWRHLYSGGFVLELYERD